jgi:hypothetical protein
MSSVLISSLPNILSSAYTNDDLLVIVGYSGNPSGATYHTPLTSFTQYVSAHTPTITGASLSSGILTIQTPVGNFSVTGLYDIYVTGGTYNVLNDTATFKNTTGGTFSVTGFTGATLPAGVNEDVQFNSNGAFGAASLKYRSSNSSTWNRGANNISSNTVFGEDSMRNTTGSGNTVYGYQSYYTSGSTGGYNSAFGYQTLYSNSGGSYNSAFGYKSQYTSTNSSGNTSMGANSLYFNLSGNDNVGIGVNSLSALTSGSRNVSVGYEASKKLTTANDIVAIGTQSLYSNISSSGHTAVGYQTLYSLTGSTNPTVAIGTSALKNFNPTNNESNLAIGSQALQSVVNFSSGNTAVGTSSLSNLVNYSYDNTSIGYNAGISITNAVTGNTLIGAYAGSNLNGSYNTIIGYYANTNLTGSSNVLITNNTTNSATGNTNIGVGSVLGGNFNVNNTIAFGVSVLNGNLTGSGNTAFGYNVLNSLTTGNNNICFGNYIASQSSSTGLTNNVLIGFGILDNTLANNVSGTTAVGISTLISASGNNNTTLGYNTGFYLTGGSNNTLIGYNAGGIANFSGNSNVTLIGYNANLPSSGYTDNNAIVLGDTNVTTLRCNATSITSLSDVRDKTDIQTIPVGIDFVNELNPVTFTWNRRDGSMIGEKSSGFIAQELKEIEDKYGMGEWLNLVNSNDLSRYEATPGNLLPVLVKAIQDLSKEQKELEMILKTLENK